MHLILLGAFFFIMNFQITQIFSKHDSRGSIMIPKANFFHKFLHWFGMINGLEILCGKFDHGAITFSKPLTCLTSKIKIKLTEEKSITWNATTCARWMCALSMSLNKTRSHDFSSNLSSSNFPQNNRQVKNIQVAQVGDEHIKWTQKSENTYITTL